VAKGRFIETRDLPGLTGAAPAPAPTGGLTPGTTVDEAERQLIMLTLASTNNNKTRAAAMLGISLKTLHNKLNRFRIQNGDEGV
jgi:DNA-binding NtrC family response regulator